MGAKEPPREETYVSRDEEIRPDVFEVSGSIKWFDPAKGYGFILPDEELPDVLLHVSCLRRDGFQTAYEGARIICDVVKTPKGLQAARIRGMPASICRVTFSSTTIASSTTKPVEIVSAISDRLSRLYPIRYITPNVPISDTGTATLGIKVARPLRRNR